MYQAVSQVIPIRITWVLLLLFLTSGCSKDPASDNAGPVITDTTGYTEILGRPTDKSVTLSILFAMDVETYLEYGTAAGEYSNTTEPVSALKDEPEEADMMNLAPGSRYYYRIRFRDKGSSSAFKAGKEHSFVTRRLQGETFTFAVEADPHLDQNSDTAAYSLALRNILLRQPDFLIDLGDTFFSEKQPVINQDVITARHLLYRPFFGSACHSVPLFLALGNHEGELGWRLDGTDKSMPVLAANTRKKYYPNPYPGTFYSGNSKSESYVGLRENYYAWEWGDALFVVLDPYWYTTTKPGWGWTLGKDQYDWFKYTLSSSKAKFKFVFCHNLVGGNGNDARGGTEFAGLFEQGGYNLNGSYGFDTYRPGWGKPLHTIMKENNVSVFFHGHDHFYCKQTRDGIVYQEVPQPSNTGITQTSAAEYGYTEGVILPGRGFMLVTVSPSEARVEYIGTFLPREENATRKNNAAITSYTIGSK